VILKQVIRYADTNSVEATWIEIISPAVDVPEAQEPDAQDAEGNTIPGKITPAHTIPAVERQVRCHSYSDRQMDMLRADLGADAVDHEALIAIVEADMRPIIPPTAEELALEAQRLADAEAKAEAKADNTVADLIVHTPLECYSKVQADVTDLASARIMLGRLAMAISVLARRELR
jgi:hypothetical protein